MDATTRRSRALSGERGFTIVELMVVIGIIALLIAIGMPMFLGAAHSAENRKAQADLRDGLAAALVYFVEAGAGSYDGFDAAQAVTIEPTVVWVDGGAPTGGDISIHVHAGPELLMVRRSTSGDYFCVAQVAGSPSTTRGSGATFTDVDTVAECTGGW